MVEFALATRRLYLVMGAVKEEITCVDITAVGASAELVSQHCKDGSSLFVEGRLRLESWKTSAGQKRSKLVVVAESIQLLDE